MRYCLLLLILIVLLTVTGETKSQYWEAEFIVTAYTHTGYRTASGVWPRVGSVAVDPEVIPLGSKLHIPGYGPGTAHDTGEDIKGYRLDIFFDSYDEAINYGRKKKKVRVYY